MIGVVNKSCGLDIHKRFFIATILSKSCEKQQQRFDRDEDGILAFKNWVVSEKWVPLQKNYDRNLLA